MAKGPMKKLHCCVWDLWGHDCMVSLREFVVILICSVQLLCEAKMTRYLKGWKRILDKDNTNRCNWYEFQAGPTSLSA